MYLVVGLGNPEKKYFNTFHNMGFMCVDRLADKLGVAFDKCECKSVTAHARVNGQKVIIAKPVTYMNLSGQAVVELTNKYKIEKGNLIVVYDDVDIPIGNLRIRHNGSAGTHNGMRSVISCVGTTDIPRLRIGVGVDKSIPLADYVLAKIPPEQRPAVEQATDSAVELILDKLNQSR